MEARTRTELPQVTERQLEVARLIAAGLDNPRIAEALGISLSGAKYHVSELLGRLDLSSREEIGEWYRAQGTARSKPRRFSFAPVGWAAALGSVGAAAIAAVAIALGSSGGGGPVSPPTAAPSAAATAAPGEGAFVAAARPQVEQRMRFTSTLLEDGSVLLAGGQSRESRDEIRSEIYDPPSDSFELTGTTIVPRYSHVAVRLLDGRALLLGGLTIDPDTLDATVVASIEAYDPATEAFELQGSMLEPRWAHAAAVLDSGHVLISGGVLNNDAEGQPLATAAAELYDPATGAFTATGPMNVARRDHQLTRLLDGRVLVSGGGPLEVYDPGSGEFSLLGGEPVFGNERTVATRLLDGRVLITGAIGDAEARALGRTDQATLAFVVDPASGSVDRTGDMRTGRSGYHTATLLRDGRVLVAGGAGGFGEQTIYPPSEIYDPVTGQFEAIELLEDDALPGGVRATNVATHIAGHHALLLDDGSVLVIGLRPSSLETVVERFDPGASAGDDRYADVLATMAARPRLVPGDVIEVGTPTGSADPLDLGAFVAAAAERGLQIRRLPTGIGTCAEGALRSGAHGLRAERGDGSGAEDFSLYVYTSASALAELWIVDDSGTVTPRPGTSCAHPSTGGFFVTTGATGLINGNQLLVLGGRHRLGDLDEDDPETRALLIEAFESMPE